MKRRFVFAALVWLPSAGYAAPPEGRTELTVLLGVSLLDVERSTSGRLLLAPDTPVPSLPVPAPVFPPPPFEFRQTRSMGGSFLQGLRVGRYVGERAQIALSFAIAPTHEQRSSSDFACPARAVCGVPAVAFIPTGGEKVVAYHYDLGLAYDLTGADARPFLSFGVGGVSYDASGGVQTDFTLAFAGGIKMYFGRLGASLEVADRITPDHSFTGEAEHDLHVRAGFVFRLP
jgi:hypothetical protein